MYSRQFVSAVAAFGMASGAMAIGCSDATITVNSAADATQLAECTSVKGDVIIGASSGSEIDIGGTLSSIGGDLTVENNGVLTSFKSDSLESIGGTWTMNNLTILSTLQFTTLSSVGSIDWATLNALPQLTMSDTGITDATSVVITDTFLSTLDGINIHSLSTMNINNNRYLTTFTTELYNVTELLSLSANGLNLTFTADNLEWAANMTIANVTSFSTKSLAAVNGSMRFDSNYFESFTAANLTQVGGDVSFINCGDVTEISFPKLGQVGGGLTIANNTQLAKLDGFPVLKTVGGAVALRGSFSEVELPKLDDVKGAFTVVSTKDIDSSCSTFDKLSSSGGNGEIQGSYSCTSNDASANNDTSSAGSGSDSGSSSSGSSSSKSGASGLATSMSTVVSLAALGALVSAFL